MGSAAATQNRGLASTLLRAYSRQQKCFRTAGSSVKPDGIKSRTLPKNQQQQRRQPSAPSARLLYLLSAQKDEAGNRRDRLRESPRKASKQRTPGPSRGSCLGLHT